MSNYGQQPPHDPQSPYARGSQNPYGQSQANPYGQPNPYSQPQWGQGQPAWGQPQNPWVAQNAPRAGLVKRAIPVVTLDSLPGREIAEVLGDAVGVVARSRELPPELRSAGPQAGYVAMLTQSRHDAVTRLVEVAQAAGADAIVGLRFDASEITQSMSEVVAYGTAVRLVPSESDDTEAAGAVGAASWPGTYPADSSPPPAQPASAEPGPFDTEEETARQRRQPWPPPAEWPPPPESAR